MTEPSNTLSVYGELFWNEATSAFGVRVWTGEGKLATRDVHDAEDILDMFMQLEVEHLQHISEKFRSGS